MLNFDATAHSAAEPATVYALLRDASTWPQRTSIDSYAPGGGEGVGEIRLFTRGKIVGRDEVIELVDNTRLAYRHTSKLPVRDYVGTIELTPAGGGTDIRWHVTFRPKFFVTGVLLKRGLREFTQANTTSLAAHAEQIR